MRQREREREQITLSPDHYKSLEATSRMDQQDMKYVKDCSIPDNLPELASSGVALCGICINGNRAYRHKRPAKRILKCPKKCAPLESSTEQARHLELKFSTEAHVQQFCEATRTSGWNAALNLIPPLVKMQVSSGASQLAASGHSTGADASCEMEVYYLPLKSFQINKRSMQLSDEAMVDLQAVQSRQQAATFLSQYHSHVSTGLHHLGAITFRLATSQSLSQSSQKAAKKKTTLTAESGLSIATPSHLSQAANASLGFENEGQSTVAVATLNQEARGYHYDGIIGGRVGHFRDIDAFLRKTEDTPSSWAIIDSQQRVEDLVPIWELILQTGDEDLRKPAALLREVWESSVAGLVHEDQELFELHQASITSASPHVSQDSIMEKVSEAVQALLENPDRLSEDFLNLWLLLPHDHRPELMKIPAFVQLSEIVATRDDLKPEKEMLQRWNILPSSPEGSVGDHHRLEEEVIPGKEQLRQLSKPGQEDVIKPEELPDKLLELVSLNGATPHRPQPDYLTESQVDAVSSMLKRCINANTNHVAVPRISEVIEPYGFKPTGEILFDISRQVIEGIVQELKLAITKANASSTVIAGAQQSLDCMSSASVHVTKLDSVMQAGASHEQDVHHSNNKMGFKFTYVDDILTHRPFPQKDKLKHIIDRIKHGLPPFQDSELQVIENNDFWSDTDDDAESHEFQKDHQEPSETEEADAARCLLQIYENSDPPARIALLRLLLDQRWGVPLVYARRSVGNLCYFNHTFESLDCVLTRIQAAGTSFDLVKDTCLPRVVFLSSHANSEHEHMAQQVTKFRFLPFSCQFERHTLRPLVRVQDLTSRFSQRPDYLKASEYTAYMRPDSKASEYIAYMQLGMGFIQVQNSLGLSPNQDSIKPYLALVVSGDYNGEQCIEFLNEVADMLIMQVPCRELAGHSKVEISPCLTCKTVLRWSIASSGVPGENRASKEIWGTSDHVSKEIAKLIKSRFVRGGHLAMNMNLQKNRRDLRSICTNYFYPKDLTDYPEDLTDAINQTDFKNLREDLVLQQSFMIEATAKFESLQLRHDNGHKQLKLRECNSQRQKRDKDVPKVARIPIIQYFLHVLRSKDAGSRIVCIHKLQKLIRDESQKNLVKLNDKADQAFKVFESTHTHEARVEYNVWTKACAQKEVGMVHLWRELSHMFLANPRQYSELPKLAAKHLLDGFPLEILDGDAKLFCELWVSNVLQEVEQLIKSNPGSSAAPAARILVLSVLGTQSSGKSTLLNVMFGSHLASKAGRCTRGVHIQLVKSGWPQYDYILLMDTEGIRCPENFGAEHYLSHDNRLATFAVLPADACILVVSNEEDNSLKEVLPMVLLAFRGSAAAEKSGGRLRSKLFFVYRSVNVNEAPTELRRNKQKLLEGLVEAEGLITKPKFTLSSKWSHEETKDQDKQDRAPNVQNENATGRTLFGFHVADDEDVSDVKFLGSFKKESKPPEDVPDSSYGEKVLQFRDYLHKRVTSDTDWKPFDLKDFGSYMNLVWSCIWNADFELSFVDAVQYRAFLELQESLQQPRLMVTRAYVKEMEQLEEELRDAGARAATEIADIDNLQGLQFHKVNTTIQQQTKKVEDILEKVKLLKWKAEERQQWRQFLTEQDSLFKGQLKDNIMSVVFPDKLLNEHTQIFLQKIIAPGDSSGHPASSFESLFKEILSYAEHQHTPMAHRVPVRVNNVYKRHKDIDDSCVADNEAHQMNVEGKCLNELIDEHIRPTLTTARHYSDDLVEDAITLTNVFIDKHPLIYDEYRQRTTRVHAGVKSFLVQQLSQIQESWDEQHNPAETVKKQKNHFELVYNNHMSRYDMTNLLLEDLKRVFKENLRTTLQDSLVKELCSSLEKEPWLSNWRVIRELLDTFLLKLLLDWEAILTGREDEMEGHPKVDSLIDFVGCDTLLHRIVVEELIKKSLQGMTPQSLHQYREKVKDAGSYASACAATAAAKRKPGAIAILTDMLIKVLKSDMPASGRICSALRQE